METFHPCNPAYFNVVLMRFHWRLFKFLRLPRARYAFIVIILAVSSLLKGSTYLIISFRIPLTSVHLLRKCATKLKKKIAVKKISKNRPAIFSISSYPVRLIWMLFEKNFFIPVHIEIRTYRLGAIIQRPCTKCKKKRHSRAAASNVFGHSFKY